MHACLDPCGPRDAIRAWADEEGLKGEDGQAVLLVALVSVCPELKKLLPGG